MGVPRGGRMAYIAYQIWLSRNNLIFKAEVMPIHQILKRAYCLAKEYSHFDTTNKFLVNLIS